MKNDWIAFTDNLQLQSGDIFACSSKFPTHYPILADTLVPAIAHVGIIIIIDNKTMLLHNHYDNGVEIIPYDSFFYGKRKISRIIRTNLSTEELLKRYTICKDDYCNVKQEYLFPFKFFFRNCEDFVRSITGFDIGFDQRLGYFILISFIAIFILFLFVLFRQKTA